MKTLIGILSLSLSLAAFADGPASTNATPKSRFWATPERVAERRDFSNMRRFGGILRKENSAFGKVVFLNAQKLVPASAFKPALAYIDYEIHPLLEMKDVASANLTNPSADIAKAGGKIGVVLGESADLPALLVAPELGWAVVNVTALKADCKDDAVLAARARKELLRAFALAAGASFMAPGSLVLEPGVRTPSGLDPLPEFGYGADIRLALQNGLPGYGVTPWKQVTYKQACQEGWAHSPTNEFQKKIWDRVHKLPTNPLPLTKPTK